MEYNVFSESMASAKSVRQRIELEAKQNWELVSVFPNPYISSLLFAFMFVFKREIPDTPTEQETKIANIGDSCFCCNDESQPPTDAWDDEDASSEPPTENVQETLRKVSEQMELEEVASPTPAEDHQTQRDWPI